MSYELKGTIHKIYDKQTITETFEKREFVVKTEEDYPQFIKLEVKQKQLSLLDEYNEGDEVVVNFNIGGKESKGNFWNNLTAWRIRSTKDVPGSEKDSAPTKEKKPATKKEKKITEEPTFSNPSKEDDDMPF